MRAVAWLVSVAALACGTTALAETLTCTDWQGIRTCSSPGGCVSHETQWQGRTYRSDNRGDTWSTSRWEGMDITTVTPPPERAASEPLQSGCHQLQCKAPYIPQLPTSGRRILIAGAQMARSALTR
jgi:hypothetical protein